MSMCMEFQRLFLHDVSIPQVRSRPHDKCCISQTSIFPTTRINVGPKGPGIETPVGDIFIIRKSTCRSMKTVHKMANFSVLTLNLVIHWDTNCPLNSQVVECVSPFLPWWSLPHLQSTWWVWGWAHLYLPWPLSQEASALFNLTSPATLQMTGGLAEDQRESLFLR